MLVIIIISEMKNILKMKDALLDILFPPICLHCKNSLSAEEKSSRICGTCVAQISIHTTLFCARCRARLPENKKICHRDMPYMLAAAVNYDGPVKDLIHQLKYRHWTTLTDIIRPIIYAYVKNLALPVEDYVIVPIPLHPERLRERGFNQAELIGSIISEALGLPMAADALERIKKTKSQAELKNYAERSNNVTGAFRVKQNDAIWSKNIILVDDVYTSGATINDAMRSLREAGAKKVIAFVLAKTR